MNKTDCAALDATIRAIVQARPDLRPDENASALAEAVVGGASEAVVFLARETIRERTAALEALDALRRIEGRRDGLGVMAYLKNGGTLERAAQMANHASTRTMRLYDRRAEEVTLDEVERIGV